MLKFKNDIKLDEEQIIVRNDNSYARLCATYYKQLNTTQKEALYNLDEWNADSFGCNSDQD